jgi:NtrC-family two-component system sensor histidine kinase KinB
MTLRRRILVGYGISLTLIGIVLAWAIYHLSLLSNAIEGILRENYKSIQAASHMIESAAEQELTVYEGLTGGDPDSQVHLLEEQSDFLQWLGRGRDNITVSGEGAVIDSIEQEYTTLLTRYQDLNRLLIVNPAAGLQYYRQALVPQLDKVRLKVSTLREMNQLRMYQASTDAQKLGMEAVWSMVIIGGAGLLVGLGFSVLVSRMLVKPIGRLTEATRRLAEGDYSVKIPLKSNDELGRLADEFNKMTDKLGIYQNMNLEQLVNEKLKNEAILAGLDDGIVVVSPELEVISVNPAARRILDLGYEKVERRRLMDVVRQERLIERVRQTVQQGRPPDPDDDSDVISLRRQDATRYYSFTITPVRNREEALSGVVVMLHDVTRLKELDRLKSEFVMSASHELRTPLTGIGMSVELLLENTASRLNENDRELLEAAREEVARLKELISDLLDLSKIESGRIEMALEPVTVRGLFERVESLTRATAREKRITLELRLPDDLPEVRADVDKIYWVLTNLVGNALKYAPRGGWVRLGAQRVGERVHLTVQDNGPGIAPEEQSRIFGKFVQVRGGEQAGGSGLGLAIAKEIVRAHGGSIWVESAPGQGSSFIFTLPIAE